MAGAVCPQRFRFIHRLKRAIPGIENHLSEHFLRVILSRGPRTFGSREKSMSTSRPEHLDLKSLSAVIPTVAPVRTATERPLWSVMIPTYNCARYLRETLGSVLAQDPGPKVMQIEVVDDCSTKDDPQAVCRELGGDRVAFYRQPQNVGVSKNFNTCVQRSRGHLVHILHGDDLVEPSFYERMAALARQWPDVAIYMCRARVITEEGEEFATSKDVPLYHEPSFDAEPLWYVNVLRTPAIVVRRSFYETHGGFCEGVSHVADWEMWVRAVAAGGGVMLDELLARYREFGGNDTSRLRRTADHLREFLRAGRIFKLRYRRFDADRFHQLVRQAANWHVNRFRRDGDLEAAANNERFLLEIPPPGKRLWQRLAGGLAGVGAVGSAMVRRCSLWRRKA